MKRRALLRWLACVGGLLVAACEPQGGPPRAVDAAPTAEALSEVDRLVNAEIQRRRTVLAGELAHADRIMEGVRQVAKEQELSVGPAEADAGPQPSPEAKAIAGFVDAGPPTQDAAHPENPLRTRLVAGEAAAEQALMAAADEAKKLPPDQQIPAANAAIENSKANPPSALKEALALGGPIAAAAGCIALGGVAPVCAMVAELVSKLLGGGSSDPAELERRKRIVQGAMRIARGDCDAVCIEQLLQKEWNLKREEALDKLKEWSERAPPGIRKKAVQAIQVAASVEQIRRCLEELKREGRISPEQRYDVMSAPSCRALPSQSTIKAKLPGCFDKHRDDLTEVARCVVRPDDSEGKR